MIGWFIIVGVTSWIIGMWMMHKIMKTPGKEYYNNPTYEDAYCHICDDDTPHRYSGFGFNEYKTCLVCEGEEEKNDDKYDEDEEESTKG